MSDGPRFAPDVPAELRPLLLTRFNAEYILDPAKRWEAARPWKLTCRACQKAFYPTMTNIGAAVANLLYHSNTTCTKKGTACTSTTSTT